MLARSSSGRGIYRELERDKEVSLGRYQVRSMSDLLARRRLNRQRHGSSRTRPRAGRQEDGVTSKLIGLAWLDDLFAELKTKIPEAEKLEDKSQETSMV